MYCSKYAIVKKKDGYWIKTCSVVPDGQRHYFESNDYQETLDKCAELNRGDLIKMNQAKKSISQLTLPLNEEA